ncbi:alpha/beta hydrolase family protein [Sphingomonas alpina]|uniref:Alpha/beta fold hydrolase n=1 Tax=Sphingomonas alpina TaxID=653931 RepID=A0A7H0LM76_9SPHN|nr:alpha/beta fold hydrolase [Sphingomonas alpina]QNQ10779.1 alpha/beta fold hydrolase [Sphingomonas alpina]
MATPIERRRLIQAAGLAVALFNADRATIAAPGWQARKTPRSPWYDLGLFEDGVMNSQLLHALGTTYSGSADIGEVLDTGVRIDGTDDWSWPREWMNTAQRVERTARASEQQDRRTSAGKAYLRAATYYRQVVMHHPEPSHSSNRDAAQRSSDAYRQAVRLLRWPAQPVQIPYENTALPGYFLRSPRARGDAPLIILQQGRDAWPEASKHICDDALERGYHALFVHSPGQGMALRAQGLPFRHDWERVVSPMIDFAERIAGVDRKRIGLLGWSMGGALVPRAAAFEHRIKLIVANPGVLDWGASTFEQLEIYIPELLPLLDSDPARFDREIRALMDQQQLIRWFMRDAMAKHGVGSPSALLFELRRYSNVDSVRRIKARTLVMDGSGETTSVGQARQLYDALRCPKTFMLFEAEDTGLLHCQEGAAAVSDHRLFDWIDEYI